MEASLAEMMDTVWAFLPQLGAATAILLGGWIVARVLGAAVAGGLKRTHLDNQLARWMEGSADGLAIEKAVGRGVYYIAMLFVLVAFFQALGLELITEPLNALLTQISEFAPRVLAAAGLLLVAWVIATVLRRIISTAMGAAKLDERLGDSTLEEGQPLPLSRTLAEAVYWLVFLLFLPAVLGALAIEGLLEPVQSLTDRLLSFLPNLLAAGLIFAVGWMVARLIQRIVTNLLAAAGFDTLPARIGVEGFEDLRLSNAFGLLLYVLVLIPVVISSLNALELGAITMPASEMLGQILTALPILFAAALVLLIAYAAGKLASSLVTSLLAGAGVDTLPARLGFPGAGDDEGRALSDIAGSLTLVVILVFAAVEAADMVGFRAVADALVGLIEFGGQALLGLFVLGMGLWLGDLAAGTIRESGVGQAAVLAMTARVSVIALASAMALRQLGVGESIIELAFGLTLGAVAVAAALAFGLGGRDIAAEEIRRWRAAPRP